MRYAKFTFKGNLIITGVAKDTEIEYNEYMKNHPVAIKITPMESVWTGNLHFVTHGKIRFSLWDLKSIVLVEDYLSEESNTEKFLDVEEKPKQYYLYWRRVARKIETLGKGRS